MENLTPNTKVIRVSYDDPDATDSSSDEESDKTQKKSKRKVHEIEVEFVEKNQKPRSGSENLEERSMVDFRKPNPAKAGKKIIGVQMTKSGKFGARIKDPIKKKYAWLGTFATAEEASRAYDLAKESAFARKLRAKKRVDSDSDWVGSEKSSPFQDSVPSASGLTSVREKINGVRRRKSGKFCAEIKHPITKRRVWISTFATAEEASMGYLAKEAEFEKELRAKQGFDKSLAADSVSSDLSNETGVAESVGENKVSGNEEVEFGFLFGVQVVDTNGFLIGEFAMLDDLSICLEEEVVNS